MVNASVSHTLATNVEPITLTGTAAINATGNALDNTLTGNSAANVLTGGAGNDLYVVGTGDTTIEVANAGGDTVQSAVAWKLAANVETLTLTGTMAVNGTGNTEANVLIGNRAADTITENDTTAGNTDIARFETGIAIDQLWFRKLANDLEVSIIGTADKFTLSN